MAVTNKQCFVNGEQDLETVFLLLEYAQSNHSTRVMLCFTIICVLKSEVIFKHNCSHEIKNRNIALEGISRTVFRGKAQTIFFVLMCLFYSSLSIYGLLFVY